MQKAKKVKVDMNPKRVQNPYEHLKRSPGKFDQKVYMEQECFSSQAIKEMAKIHAMQMHAVNATFDKTAVRMRKKKAELDAKNTSYGYMKQLRDAFLNENQRRKDLITKIKEDAIKAAEAQRRASEEKMMAEAAAAEAEKVKNYKPWEQEKSKPLPSIKQNNRDQPQGHPVVQAGNKEQNQSTNPNGDELPDLDLEALINTTDRSLLEKLSEDIVCGTLPVDRLRRLLPSEEKPSGSSYPIMSNYRRVHVLPDVKKFKRRMSNDTLTLHGRINNYFGVNVPLNSYTIPKSAKPRKQKLLKAISHEDFRLPKIPPPVE